MLFGYVNSNRGHHALYVKMWGEFWAEGMAASKIGIISICLTRDADDISHVRNAISGAQKKPGALPRAYIY
jgi:hypothetical protein